MASPESHSLDLNKFVEPYVNCLARQQDRIVSEIHSNGPLAATDTEAAQMEAQVRARVLQLCARDRSRARTRALSALERAYRNKPVSVDAEYVDSLLTYLDGLIPPFVIAVPPPIPLVSDAPSN